jgi:hypothetical protein
MDSAVAASVVSLLSSVLGSESPDMFFLEVLRRLMNKNMATFYPVIGNDLLVL